MCQLFVEGDKVPNVNVAVVLFQENVLANLISDILLVVANKQPEGTDL